MKKSEYENLKSLKKKVKDGTATFAERNFLIRKEKKIKKVLTNKSK